MEKTKLEFCSGHSLIPFKMLIRRNVDISSTAYQIAQIACPSCVWQCLPAAVCAIFPKQTHPDISAFIQVLPDIDEFSCLANDILSFYKEELAGETTNYIHSRAKTTLKHPKRVLVEMVREVGDLHALAAWKSFEDGFIAFHLSMKRYKLSELGFLYPVNERADISSSPATVNFPQSGAIRSKIEPPETIVA
ncbi:hypothetical protein B0H13DRAFT_1868925 [Mycena leptocephala]|nr:hypothetical protein B0H13DRAFT_1868925 [Mycena leptocephala]